MHSTWHRTLVPAIGVATYYHVLMATIEERLQALEDERSILRTLFQYSNALDEDRDPARFIDCFTESAVWRSSIDGPYAGAAGATLRLEGHKEIAAWFLSRPRRGDSDYSNSKKYLCDSVIDIDGDEARCSSHHLDVKAQPEGPVIWAIARYFDRLVRCPDGRWRLAERHLSREGVGPAGQTGAAGR
jgi:SnoaL-like domain